MDVNGTFQGEKGRHWKDPQVYVPFKKYRREKSVDMNSIGWKIRYCYSFQPVIVYLHVVIERRRPA